MEKKYYQIIYTASEESRSGSSGLGIRSATEGTPDYVLSRIDSSKCDYHCGKFPQPTSSELGTDPSSIEKCPRSYFYTVEKGENDKKLYFLGRIVAIGYDFSFYKTGKTSTRTGNCLSHTYVFEEAPDQACFDLLFEQPMDGSHVFLPVNLLPKMDNEELKSLLLGPHKDIPISTEPKPFTSAYASVPEVSYDVLFDLLSAMNNGKRLIVKMDAFKAPAVCAGLMRLLPERFAQEMTFVINHQAESVHENTRLVFINQYFPHESLEGNFKTVDYLDGTRTHVAGEIEKKWRAELTQCVNENDFVKARLITNWLLNKLSLKLVSRTVDFDWAILNYLYAPDAFELESLSTIEGLLPILAKIIANDDSKKAFLAGLLNECFANAKDANDLNQAISLVEELGNNGISLNEVYMQSRPLVTSFVTASPANMNGVLLQHAVPVLKKYLDMSVTSQCKNFLSDEIFLSKWDSVYSIFYQAPYPVTEIFVLMLQLHLSENKTTSVLKEIAPDAQERVAMYVQLLKKNPDQIADIAPYLNWDKNETRCVDFVKEFAQQHNQPLYAPFFLMSIEYKKDHDAPAELLVLMRLCKQIADVNESFRSLILKQEALYSAFYSRLITIVKPAQFQKLVAFIDSDVLPLVQSASVVRNWQVLRDVAAGVVPSGWSEPHYRLAITLKASDFLKKFAPCAFDRMTERAEIESFVNVLLDVAEYDIAEIVDGAKRIQSSHSKKSYVLVLAKREKMSFDKIRALTEQLEISNPGKFYFKYFRMPYVFYLIKNLFKKKNRK